MVKSHLVSTSRPVSRIPAHQQQKLTDRSEAIIKSSKIVKLVSNEDENEDVVTVHKELLCFFSPYYAASLNGKFLEAQKDQFEVDLVGQDLRVFISWIYTGELTEESSQNANLYVFADQVDILALRRDALSQLSRRRKQMLKYCGVKHVLENVTQQSQIYKWMLDSYIAHWGPSADDDDDDECILDRKSDLDYLLSNFIYQVMRGIATRDNNGDPIDSSQCPCCAKICLYHEHESKAEWKASTLSQSVRSRFIFH